MYAPQDLDFDDPSVDFLLMRVQAAAEAVRKAQKDLDARRAHLDSVVAAAAAGGASVTRVAIVGRLSRETVHKAIRRARKPRTSSWGVGDGVRSV